MASQHSVAASILGTSVMEHFSDRIAPNLILLFGPGSSVLAALGMSLIPAGSSPVFFYACAFLLGFGPSMWLVTRNSVRQLVTPSERLGRVNAVIQTAIYGIRPIGALAGGLVAGSFGPRTGMVLVFLSRMRRRSLPRSFSDTQRSQLFGIVSPGGRTRFEAGRDHDSIADVGVTAAKWRFVPHLYQLVHDAATAGVRIGRDF